MEFNTPEEYWQYEMLRQRLQSGVVHESGRMDGVVHIAPQPESRLTSEEEAVDPDQEIVLAVKDNGGMTAAPGPKMPASPKTRRPRPHEVYVTDIEGQVLRLLRQHPDGLNSNQIARLLGVTVSKASITAWRLRAERPSMDTTTPLVTKVTDGRHRVTALGEKLRLIVVKRPKPENDRIGWGD